jgi:hypothetical protein
MASKTKPLIDSHEYDDFILSISKGFMRPPDQLVKLKAVISSHSFTSDQAVEIINKTKGCYIDSATLLYSALNDPENFQKCLDALQWKEDREDVLNNLGLDHSNYKL